MEMDPGGNLDVNCVETGNPRLHCCINLMLGLKLLLFDGWGFKPEQEFTFQMKGTEIPSWLLLH